jgi:hypothetical protein
MGHSGDVMPDDLEYRYDRPVDEDFLKLFDSHGAFRTLREYAQEARYPVDFQFRLNPKTTAQHASLYVGLSTVLDVHLRPGSFKLAANSSYHHAGFRPEWMSWRATSQALARAAAVDDYLDAVIPMASAGSAAVEGAVQAAVSTFGSDKRVMLDYEVQLHFRDTPTKGRVMGKVCADLLRAAEMAPVPGARPSSFGGKCDLLALDSSGRPLAVAVKPRRASKITWASAQAIGTPAWLVLAAFAGWRAWCAPPAGRGGRGRGERHEGDASGRQCCLRHPAVGRNAAGVRAAARAVQRTCPRQSPWPLLSSTPHVRGGREVPALREDCGASGPCATYWIAHRGRTKGCQ